MVVILQAPDDEVFARIALELGSGGNLRTHTLKAFSEADYRRIIQTLP